MNKLLHAGLIRLLKSKVFQVLFLLMFVLGLYFSVGAYMDMKKYNYTYILDSSFFQHIMFMGIIIAVFCSLFVGTEYSDGTIRNKLIVGHSRVSIYISNLILCTAASILFSFAYMLACACAGIPLLGFFQMDLKSVVLMIFYSIVITIAYTSIFTFAAMLIHNKAVLSVITVIASFLLLFAATYLYSSLSQPEMRSDYIINESGAVEQTEPAPNEFYVSGTKRKVYEFLMEFLPSGQDVLLLNGDIPPVRMIFYDFLILISTTGIGLFCFRKKNIN